MIKRNLVISLLLISLGLPLTAKANDTLAALDIKSLKQEEEFLLLGEEFVITATKRPQEVKKAPAIVTVITAEQIKQMGARNLSDVLRIVPGLELATDEMGKEQVSVRGIKTTESEKVKLMIDGMPLNNVNAQSPLTVYYDYPLEHIKRVEVIRGPGSALYGSNAFVAVINLITKDARDVDGFEVTGWGGSFDTQKYNVLFGKEYGDFRLLLMVDYYDTDGPHLEIENDKIWSNPPLYEPARSEPYEGETLYWQENINIYAEIGYSDLELKVGYQERDQGPYIGLQYWVGDDTETKDHYELFGELSYRHSFGAKMDVLAKVYGQMRKFNMLHDVYPEGFELWVDVPIDINGDGIPDFFLPVQYADYPEGVLGEPHWRTRKTGGEIQFDYELLKGNTLTLGAVLEYEKIYDVWMRSNVDTITLEPLPGGFQKTDQVLFEEGSRDSWALYIQDEWEIIPELAVTLGARYDHYEGFGGTFNPRAGLAWLPLDDVNIKLLYGEAFRAPSFNELYMKNNPVRQGNPDLDPEKIRTFEASVGYDFTRQVTGRISYFYNKITDQITTEDISPYKFTNKGGSKTHGVELELKAKYDDNTYAYANYSYQDARDDDTKKRLPDVSQHKGNIGVNVGLWKYLNVNTTILLRGEKPRAEDDPRDDMPGYGVVNLALIGHNFVDGLEVFGSIYNLFDKEYAYPAPANTLPDDFPAPGRAYYAGVRYRF